MLADPHHPLRAGYLARFADREGTSFLNQFYAESPAPADAVLDRLAGEVRRRADAPGGDLPLGATGRGSRRRSPRSSRARLPELPGERELDAALRQLCGRTSFTLNDRAYLARRASAQAVARGLSAGASGRDPQRDAGGERRRSARRATPGCSRPGTRPTQDKRIRILLEEEAFARIHEAWRRLGYPFDHLVPSYATAIGSSADRPEALAELIGIVLNDGVWQPTVRDRAAALRRGHALRDRARAAAGPARDVLAPEIAARGAQGADRCGRERHGASGCTAPSATSDGAPIPIGAKTGTGDHRRKSFGPRRPA